MKIPILLAFDLFLRSAAEGPRNPALSSIIDRLDTVHKARYVEETRTVRRGDTHDT